MANKFDIEFEDDEEILAREEAERQKNAVEEVDLSFGAEPSEPTSTRKPPERAARPASSEGRTARRNEGTAVSRPKQSEAPVRGNGGHSGAPVYIGEEYRLGDELRRASVENELLTMEIEARIKIEVSQKTTELVAMNTANAKLLEHKIGKLLGQIGQKAPALKKELITIKKQLAEFVEDTAKSRESETTLNETTQKPKPSPRRAPPPKKKAA